MDVIYHYTREQVEKGTIPVVFKPTSKMTANLLTKALQPEPFKHFLKTIHVTCNSVIHVNVGGCIQCVS